MVVIADDYKIIFCVCYKYVYDTVFAVFDK